MPATRSNTGASAFPRSPTIDSSTLSSIFPYSTARPPTGYSETSLPPVPKRPRTFDAIEELDEQLTPLYARSDYSADGAGAATAPTAWSRSSFGDRTTDKHTHGHHRSVSFAVPGRTTLPRSVSDYSTARSDIEYQAAGAQYTSPTQIALPPPSPVDGAAKPVLGRLDTGTPGRKNSMPIITPTAQTRLGRMSVAKPRYTLPAKAKSGKSAKAAEGSHKVKKRRGVWDMYVACRVYVVAILGLVGALIVTVALHSGGGVGSVVRVSTPGGGWGVTVGGIVTDVASGAPVPGSRRYIMTHQDHIFEDAADTQPAARGIWQPHDGASVYTMAPRFARPHHGLLPLLPLLLPLHPILPPRRRRLFASSHVEP